VNKPPKVTICPTRYARGYKPQQMKGASGTRGQTSEYMRREQSKDFGLSPPNGYVY